MTSPNSDASALTYLLTLERETERRFTGRLQDLGRGRAYGGILIGQALAAGMMSVPERQPHSLHAYFLNFGDTTRPVTYEVEPLRDGRSLTTYRIQAVQDGDIILAVMVSFQTAEEGFEHQDSMPDVAPPEGLPTDFDIMRERLGLKEDDPNLSERSAQMPFEIRHIYPGGFMGGDPPRSENLFWFRAKGQVPTDPLIRYCGLAYASDFGPMVTALLPHGKAPIHPDIRLASIDHAIWFHREASLDDWLLYDLQTPSSQAGRGLGFGKIFTRDGRLIASVAQEGFMRQAG